MMFINKLPGGTVFAFRAGLILSVFILLALAGIDSGLWGLPA